MTGSPPLPHAPPLCRLFLSVCLAWCVFASAGCASYTDKMVSTHQMAARGQTSEAIAQINQALGVSSSGQLPENLDKENVLLLLERAALLQAEGDYANSARDLMIADQHLNWLLIDDKTLDALSEYLYSDDAKNYRAPAYERLLLNALNMVNFLAAGDLGGARVEARRFLILESFYLDHHEDSLQGQMLALGNYLCGVTMESSADYDAAVRFYAKAWSHGLRDPDLGSRLFDLYRLTASSTKGIQDPTLEQMRAEAQAAGPLSREEYIQAHQRGDVLIVTQFGFVPYKKAVRLGATQAIALSSSRRGGSLSTARRTQADALMLSGALTSINFPELTTAGLPPRAPSSARLSLDGRWVPMTLGMNVSDAVELSWQEVSGGMIGAAIVRAITRALVGGVGMAAGESASRSKNSTTATLGIVGMLASLGTEVALNAADTPDTRSWTLLPGYITFARRTMTPGAHQVTLNVAGRRENVQFDVFDDRINVLNLSKFR